MPGKGASPSARSGRRAVPPARIRFIALASVDGAFAGAGLADLVSHRLTPVLSPVFRSVTTLPSNVTATGYPKGADMALVVLLTAGGMGGAILAARLAAAARPRTPRLEEALLAILWIGCIIYGVLAFRP